MNQEKERDRIVSIRNGVINLLGFIDKLLAEIDEASEREKAHAARDAELEKELEAGPWKEAASKKCFYWRDAPDGLVQKVRAAKGGIKGQTHHFTASSTEPTIFRFKRSEKK